jgi:hypothetical protein
MLFLVMWIAAAIFLLNCGFQRVGFSMLFPITAPFLLLDWCYKKWHRQSTSDFH